jgi:HIV Tat-specific factor 1
VYLAVEMLDGAEFPREPDVSTTRISVEEADTSYKRSKDDTVAEERTGYKPKPSKALAKKKAEQMQQ